jgi:hypothetical protein
VQSPLKTFRAAAESVGKDPLESIALGSFKAVMRHAMRFLGNELFVALNEGIRNILEKGAQLIDLQNGRTYGGTFLLAEATKM